MCNAISRPAIFDSTLCKRRRSTVKHEHPVEMLYSTNRCDLNRKNDGGQAMRPIEQVEPNSYIGLASKRLKGRYEPTEDRCDYSSGNDKSSECSDFDGYESSDESKSSDESSTSKSSGSSSSENLDESSTSSSSTMSSSGKCKGRKRSGRGAKSPGKRRMSKKKHQKMKLKPIPPSIEYDGGWIHRFITEGTTYVCDGQVPAKKCMFILSHYLTGRAHEFYMREVAGDPY